MTIQTYDDRRDLVVPGNKEATVAYAVNDLIQIAQSAIKERGLFFAALSGGSTPRAIFEALLKHKNVHKVNWQKVFLFWGDERSVGPEHPDSNYRMALDAGINQLNIPPEQIFRMQAENHIQEHALEYERLIKQIVPNQTFDLSMLGMGDDGHTASLFPHTEGLTAENRLVIANHVPQKNTWRMSFTFAQIKNSRNIRIYVIGENKAAILNKVFTSPLNIQEFPSQALGWPSQKALWVLDSSAAKELQKSLLKA